MTDEKINQKYIEKIRLLQKYNKHYYNLNKPLISDSEFDKLKVRYEKVLNENSLLKKFDNIGVGALPSSKFKKVQHKLPMLSLSNAMNESELILFNEIFFNWC